MAGAPAERPAAGVAWRPKLVTGLRPVWRDGESVQFGVDPARAVVVEGVTERWMRLLLDLDGRRDDRQVVDAASAAGLDPDTAERLLADLRTVGRRRHPAATGPLRRGPARRRRRPPGPRPRRAGPARR
jgi:hypothetical protein